MLVVYSCSMTAGDPKDKGLCASLLGGTQDRGQVILHGGEVLVCHHGPHIHIDNSGEDITTGGNSKVISELNEVRDEKENGE